MKKKKEEEKNTSIDTLEIEMTRITRQLKYYTLQLKYLKNSLITIKELPTLAYILKNHPCSCNFLCNQEGSTTETMIKGVVEAKYKADKAIVHGLLRMYFHDYFVEACE